jgi:hypothetical protein
MSGSRRPELPGFRCLARPGALARMQTPQPAATDRFADHRGVRRIQRGRQQGGP